MNLISIIRNHTELNSYYLGKYKQVTIRIGFMRFLLYNNHNNSKYAIDKLASTVLYYFQLDVNLGKFYNLYTLIYITNGFTMQRMFSSYCCVFDSCISINPLFNAVIIPKYVKKNKILCLIQCDFVSVHC